MRAITAGLGFLLLMYAGGAISASTLHGVDLGVEAGTATSHDASDTRLLRFTARGRALGDSSGWSLWWEASLGGWRFEERDGDRHHLLDVGATPLLRYMTGGTGRVFVEAGVGIHYLSALYERGVHEFSTRVQFSPQVGVGYRFAGGGEVALRFQHLSNAGIKQPNPGVEFVLLSVSKAF